MNCLMSRKILNIIYLLTLIKGFVAESEYTWNFEFKETSTNTSNKDLLEFRLKNERVSRGNYALSGEFYLNYDIVDGDSNQVAMEVFRSPNNDGEYKKIPFDIQPDHFYKIMNSQYKSAIMETLHDCSDMPYFENEIPQPVEKKTYTLNKCKISQNGFPSHLDEGTYKIVLTGSGDVEWEFVVIAEVSSNE